MKTVEASVHAQAPIDRVFDLMIDTEGCPAWLKGASRAGLLEEGNAARRGVGAVRSIRLSGITFVEEIVKYDPPHSFEYKVKKSTLPMKHELGRMEFTRSGEGTDVRWISRARGKHIGRLLEPVVGRAMTKSHQDILEQAKAALAS
ncbi:MAG: SRPBCC family protein [Actinomycetota bacterium]|nr:SRPBCC family protein [Actinomycetota bacterium]